MKFEQNWLSGFRGRRLKMLMEGWTHGQIDKTRAPPSGAL